MDTRESCCAGCGRYGCRITFSHRIPRSRNINLLDDPDNIDLMCGTCHENVETGKYHLLMNGQDVLNYIKEKDLEFYYLKTLK